MNSLSKSESTGIRTSVFSDSFEASSAVANEIASLVRSRAAEGLPCVLGLATGSTPKSVYLELIRLHREEGLSLSNVITFNLDEYFPMTPDAPQSYVRFMNEELFDHVDVLAGNIHIPDGTIAKDDLADFCRDFENQISDLGGIDLQLLGIGQTGHIGFNEPGSELESVTRLVTLNSVTRMDATKDFGDINRVPELAITMGVQTILNSKSIRLLAFGDHKSAIVKRTIEGEISDAVPATFLQNHGDVEFLLDSEAAKDLTTQE